MQLENVKINTRVDLQLANYLKSEKRVLLSRSVLQDNWEGLLTVNGASVKPSYRIKEGDVVEVNMEKVGEVEESLQYSTDIKAQKSDLDVVFEDNNYLIVDKPKGMVVHPGVGNVDGTLANYVKGYLEEKNEFNNSVTRAGIVHRLDKPVSGLIVFAKNPESQNSLQKQFQEHTVKKIYLATVESGKARKDFEKFFVGKKDVSREISVLEENEFSFDQSWFKAEGYIGRSSQNRVKMEFKRYKSGNLKHAISYIKPVGDSKVLVVIKTGRMHQIRATLAYLGSSIVGDTLYGAATSTTMPDNIELESIYLSFKDLEGNDITISKY